MGQLQLAGRLTTGQTRLDWGIRDIVIAATAAGPVAYAVSGRDGGIAAFGLGGGGLAAAAGEVFFTPGISQLALEAGLLVDGPQAPRLVAAGGGAAGLIGYSFDPGDGRLAGAAALTLPDLGQAITALTCAGAGLVSADAAGGGRLVLHLPEGAGWRLAAVLTDTAASHLSGITALACLSRGAERFVLAASGTEHMVSAFRVAPDGAGLVATGAMGAAAGLGLGLPTALATARVAGTDYVLVGAAGSGTLTVMELTAAGGLVPTDQVLDTLQTRFAGVQAVETVAVGAHVFVLAGGGDGGLSLFRLLPGGRLLHLETLAGGAAEGLAAITDIAAAVVGASVEILVAAQASAGLTQLRFAVAGLGQVRAGGSGAETLAGGTGADVLAGGAGDDLLLGGEGADILEDGAGRDRLSGGAGADIFVFRADGMRDVVTDFRPGEDRLDLSALPFFYDAALLGHAATATGALLTWRGEEIELVRAGGGAISRAEALAAILAGPDRPPLFGFGGETRGTPAADLLETSWAADSLWGLAGNDTIRSGDGPDRIDAGDGRDRIYAGGGDDSLDGGTGEDTLHAGPGNDRAEGGSGRDLIHGMDGADLLLGGADADRIFAGAGRDTAAGGTGEDTLYGGAGDDSLDGGEGNDLLYGREGNDRIGGTAGNDVVWAGLGADTVRGGTGRDRVYGGPGKDLLQGEEEDDLLYGGRGSDTVEGGAGANTLHGMDGHDLIRGGEGADSLFGGTGYDRIFAGAGNDVVLGGAGCDQIYLEDGNDLFRDADQDDLHGADRVFAGAGNDTIDSAGGADLLSGGAGADCFIIRPGAGQRCITDFVPGEDRLVLDLAAGDRPVQTVTAAGLEIDWDGPGSLLLQGLGAPLGAAAFELI